MWLATKQLCTRRRFFCTFLYRCFARLRRETSLLHVLWREVVLVFIHYFFSLPPIFTLVAASISQFLTAARIFSCSSNKKRLHSFLSLAVAVCRSFSRWASLTCYLFSLFLCLSLSLNSKFVDMKINPSLILHTTRIQRQFPLFVFVFIDSLVVKTRKAMRFPAKITSSCIWVAMPVDWVILHWYACGADGRWSDVRSRDYQNFSNE